MRYFYRVDISQKWWQKNSECIWHYYAEKSWATLYYFLIKLYTQSNVFAIQFPTNLTINHIMSVKDEQQVIDKTCVPKKWSVNSSECSYEIKVNKYSIDVSILKTF